MCKLSYMSYPTKEFTGYKVAIELHGGRLVSPITGIVYKIGNISQKFSNYDLEKEKEPYYYGTMDQLCTRFVSPATVKRWTGFMVGRTAVIEHESDALSFLSVVQGRVKVGKAVLLKMTVTKALKGGHFSTASHQYVKVVAGRYIKAIEKL